MSDVTKEQALHHITQVYNYALGFGNTHPFARDVEVWMSRQWGQTGTMAVLAVKREKNAKAKAPHVNATEPRALVKFVHPKSPEANATNEDSEPAFQPPPQQAEAVEGQEPSRRGRKPKVQQAEQPKQPLRDEDENPVAEAEPLTNAELSAVKGMAPQEILKGFGEARLSATLEGLEIDHSDLSGTQKAAAVKANAGK